MAFSENFVSSENRCEICGAELSDEIVIQEFADGSIARLCAECAAGAALQTESFEFEFPEAGDEEKDAGDRAPATPAGGAARAGGAALFAPAGPAGGAAPSAQAKPADEPGAVEKTRELLTPMVDLITLQREMQGALQRLAASLESFATGVISENKDKTATVEGRLESLERELEQTRGRLRETEALLAARGATAAAASQSAADQEATGTWDSDSELAVVAPRETMAEAQELAVPDMESESVPDYEYSPTDFAAQQTPPPVASPVAPPPVAPPAGPPTAEHHNRPSFQLAEVQLAQRYFNDSQFTDRIRDVRKSLGKPKANLTKLIGEEPRALLTVAWDIIWYQYLVELRRDVPTDERVTLHREGMDLDELTGIFGEKNSSIDDEGRLDASELEVKLLSDPSTLITEMSVDEERALEDATEEIWDQKTAPEFKWDD
jgi:hypothetical protein